MKTWWYVLFGLFALSWIFDSAVVRWFAENRIELLNGFAAGFTSWYTVLIAGFIFTLLFLRNKSNKKLILPLWITGIASFVIAEALKLVFARARPDVAQLVLHTNYSFPSGHATVVFSALPILDKKFPKLKWVWLAFAVLIIISRLYAGVHYPSDLLAGCILGLAVGWFVKLLAIKYSFWAEDKP